MCWGIDLPFKNKYDIKSLSQHFEKEIYQYVNITWLLLTGKRLCWSLFLILSIAKFLRAPISKNICVWKYVHKTEKNKKLLRRDFNSSLKKNNLIPISEKSKNVFLFILISVILWFVSFGVCIYIQYSFDVVRNKLPELIKRRSKVQEKNMSGTCFKFRPVKNIFRKL